MNKRHKRVRDRELNRENRSVHCIAYGGTEICFRGQINVQRFRFSRRKFLAALLSASVASITDAFGFEPHWLRLQKIQMTPHPTCRFVQITDIHYKGDRAYLERVVQTVNAQHPEFVCFTGDLIEEAQQAPEALEILQNIQSPLFGIPGNHDHWADLDFDLPRCSPRRAVAG